MHRRLPFLLGALVCLTAACSRDTTPPPDHIVLITVDTLRADHLAPYGSTSTHTPHVARLAAEGVLFENAAAPMPTTRPSHATMLTGRYPREHGLTENHLRLPTEELSVAEVFRDQGYRTAAFVGARFLGRGSGLEQGFEVVEAPEGRESPAGDVVERAVRWLRGLEPGERSFVWLHFFDPHTPYAPPASFTPPPGDGLPAVDEIGWPEMQQIARGNDGDLDARSVARARQLYAGEVNAMDAAIGMLLLELDERNLAEDTVTVLTADHGECMENGYFFRHGDCLYDGAVKVPLIFRSPGRLPEGERTAGQVEHVDLASTLLALAGLDAPPSFGGRPLFDRDGSLAEAEADRLALIQLHVSARRLAGHWPVVWRGIESVAGAPMGPPAQGLQLALRNDRWKYVARDGGSEELYDLAADPAESRNLAGERPRRLRELRAALRSRLADMPLKIGDAEKLSPQLRKDLEAMGYL